MQKSTGELSVTVSLEVQLDSLSSREELSVTVSLEVQLYRFRFFSFCMILGPVVPIIIFLIIIKHSYMLNEPGLTGLFIVYNDNS